MVIFQMIQDIYLFTMVDHFTKFGWTILTKNKKAKNNLEYFQTMIDILFKTNNFAHR